MRLVFAGDSITDANHLWGEDPLGDGYVKILSRMHPQDEIINCGHDGFTAKRLSQCFERECLSRNPDVVTILVGVNDTSAYLYGGSYGADAYTGYIESMIQSVVSRTQAKLILMEPFLFSEPAEYIRWFPVLEEYCSQLRQLSKKYDTAFVPLWETFKEAQKLYVVRELTTDGIHLTELGHKILANAWNDVYTSLI